MYVAFSAPSKKWQFSDFRAEKNKSELNQKGHKPSRAELKILQLELWLEPARLGLITNRKYGKVGEAWHCRLELGTLFKFQAS